MEPPHGFDVVVEDLGPPPSTVSERLLLDPEEVGRQHLDRARALAPSARGSSRRSGRRRDRQVVTVDRGDDDVLQPHLLRQSAPAGAARAGRAGARAARSARSSSGRLGCRCRRGSGTSPSRDPSTPRCSGSVPPRRSCAGSARGSAPSRRRTANPGSERGPSSTPGGGVYRLLAAILSWTGWFQSPGPSSAGISSREA